MFSVQTFMLQHIDTLIMCLVIVFCTAAIVDRLKLIWRVLDLQLSYQKLDFKIRNPGAGSGLDEDSREYWHMREKEL